MPDDTPTLNASALLIVDMQNDFVRPGAPMAVPDALGTVAVQRRLLDAFRAKQLPVLYTRFLSTPTHSLLWNWSPTCAPPTCACHKGFMRRYSDQAAELDCSAVIDELRPLPDEPVVEKYGYGGFHDTELHGLLQRLGVSSLVITGTVTQICVEETAREAFHFGYQTTVVADGVSSFAPELQAATLQNFAMKFGWVVDSQTLLSALA